MHSQEYFTKIRKQIETDIVVPKDPDENIKIPTGYLDFIRDLEDFDLIMLLSDISWHGMENAKSTLAAMMQSHRIRKSN